MPDYYVLVSKLNNKGKLDIELCGKLWAKSSELAGREAKAYADSEALNCGMGIDWLFGEFYTVTAVTESEAHRYKGFRKFKKQRVTPEPLGSLSIWPDQPDWNEIAERPIRSKKKRYNLQQLVEESDSWIT